ncbi:formylglycine-generating enzyme family protein [Paenibacillus methanolicus]|uniref:Formylglycine-generating enzyme required for sulfatase activity n=1 Tax=Paenibacillus methanolicus TaxID=582686 RepID=A0A5S5C1L1_9BACL|nr:formylglycine-generating enzyme required for sulfatase activity [Paenibacillus methanolicus]
MLKPTQSCCSASRSQDVTHEAGNNAPELAQPRGNAQSGDMVWLEGGEFYMGSDAPDGFPADGEGPVRKVRVDPFGIAPYAVTNRQFAAFVDATGYVTEAERFGWSFVFHLLASEETRARVANVPQEVPWWLVVEGAYWAKPEGPDSSVEARMDHPVVHVSWHDAAAYCAWSGTRLLTEAEWEYAARGGLTGRTYPWGDELKQGGQHRCNIWQGKFPVKNNASDGYVGTAPVDAYEPNGYGLYNLSGNVWEWCADWFSPGYHRQTAPANPHYTDPTGKRAMRGGSYLCHRSYCNRYRVAARSSNTPDSSTGNIGFRVAMDRV